MPVSISSRNHYEVLGLSNSTPTSHIAAQDIRNAYRRALLQHHPDKLDEAQLPNNDLAIRTARYTIDDISLAYKILSDPRARAGYDRDVRLHNHWARKEGEALTARTGLDNADLDDLNYDEVENKWYLACRCGDDRGFVVTEGDLEKEKEHGEVLTGCHGCSLWMKISFQIAESDFAEESGK